MATKKTDKTDDKPYVPDAPVFDKEQILRSSKYREYKDALKVALSDGKTYTLGEVEQALNNFMKGKV